MHTQIHNTRETGWKRVAKRSGSVNGFCVRVCAGVARVCQKTSSLFETWFSVGAFENCPRIGTLDSTVSEVENEADKKEKRRGGCVPLLFDCGANLKLLSSYEPVYEV